MTSWKGILHAMSMSSSIRSQFAASASVDTARQVSVILL